MKKLVGLLGLFLILPVAAFAGSTCALATTTPANSHTNDFDFAAPSSSLWYQYGVTAGHSYSITVMQDFDDVNTDITVNAFSDGGTCGAALTGTTNTKTIEPALPANGTRFSYTASATGTHALQIINGNASTGRYVAVTVADTTLFSPIWNTSNAPLGYGTYYSFVNTTTAAISMTVSLFDTTGAAAGTVNINLPAKGSSVTNTNAMGVSPNKSGYAVITHNGPMGAVQGVAYVANFSSTPAFTEPVPVEPINRQ